MVAALQFLITALIGTRIKKSIDNEYKTSLEKYKDELLRRKTIYEEQLNAYKSFSEIMYKIYPEKYHPDMDWGEAVESIATGFRTHYKDIRKFLITRSAILPKDIKEKIESCWYLCSDGQFEISKHFDVSRDGYKMAEELWEKMKEIEDDFRAVLKIDTNS